MAGCDILWHASLPACTLAERVALAAAAGFGGISVSAQDLSGTGGGPPPGEVMRMAADSGVGLHCLDSVIEWYPHAPPKRMAEAADQDADALLALCERFAIPSVSALAMFPSECDQDGMTEAFASLCDRAAGHGLVVHLEFTPFPPIAGPAGGWETVRRAGRDNGGVLLDTWHFFRSDDPQAGLDLLATIPGHRITAVQLSDGAPEFVESLLKDTFRHRLLPGAGSFALDRLLDGLDRIGARPLTGPEVLSEELWVHPAAEVAARLAAAAGHLYAGR